MLFFQAAVKWFFLLVVSIAALKPAGDPGVRS